MHFSLAGVFFVNAGLRCFPLGSCCFLRLGPTEVRILALLGRPFFLGVSSSHHTGFWNVVTRRPGLSFLVCFFFCYSGFCSWFRAWHRVLACGGAVFGQACRDSFFSAFFFSMGAFLTCVPPFHPTFGGVPPSMTKPPYDLGLQRVNDLPPSPLFFFLLA